MKEIITGHLFIFLIVLLFTSCKKSEEKYIIGTWKKIKSEERVGSTAWQDVTEACQTDDTESYETDGSWAIYDGTYQCTSGSGIVNGTWKFAASNTKVIYTYEGFSGEYESTIERLTETELVLTQSTGNIAGTQIRNTYTR